MARRLSRPQAVVLPVKDPTSDMAQFAKKGSALLQTLFAATEEGGLYTHRWKVGECLLIDNRRILHTASGRDYSGHDRLMVRVQSREPKPYEAMRATSTSSRL